MTPQLERFQQEKETTQRTIAELHQVVSDLSKAVDDLTEENRHARQTAELTDRALIRIEKKDP